MEFSSKGIPDMLGINSQHSFSSAVVELETVERLAR